MISFVFFLRFFFIEIAYQTFIQNTRATMIKYNEKINRVISLFNIKRQRAQNRRFEN